MDRSARQARSKAALPILFQQEQTMKLNVIVPVAVLGLAAGCASVPSTDGGNETTGLRITAESISALFDKRMFFIDSDGNEQRSNYFVLREDGSAEGAWNNEPLAATWSMQDDYWCRTMTEFHDATRIGAEDCQLWEQQGDDVIRVTRNRGAGVSWKQGIGEEDIQQ